MSDINPREIFGFDACDGTEPFIFVSYAHADAERIAPFLAYLNENGIPVWYDNGLEPGKYWLEQLLISISSAPCKAVMFFVSNDSLDSPFVRTETEKAFSCKKPIYGVYLDEGLTLDIEMSAYISRIQSTFIYSHESQQTAQLELLSAAQQLLGEGMPVRIKAAAPSSRSDELWGDAEWLSNHVLFDGTHDRLEEAREKYKELTQLSMRDYRGWLGLMKCECLAVPETPEQASEQLIRAHDNMSYVVNCTGDESVRAACVNALDTLWGSTLDIFENFLSSGESDSEAIHAFAARMPDSRLLRSVSTDTTARFTDTSDKLKAAEEGSRKAEEARIAAETEEKRIADEKAAHEATLAFAKAIEDAKALRKKKRNAVALRVLVSYILIVTAGLPIGFIFDPILNLGIVWKVCFLLLILAVVAVFVVLMVIRAKNAPYKEFADERKYKRCTRGIVFCFIALFLLVMILAPIRSAAMNDLSIVIPD